MKKIIAKGMISFLITLVLLTFFSSVPFCYAEETEGNIKIVNEIGKYINVCLNGYVVNVQNQYFKKITDLDVTIKVENDTIVLKKDELKKLNQGESERIDLAQYFNREYLDNHSIEVKIHKNKSNLISHIGILLVLIIILLVEILRIKSTIAKNNPKKD